VRVFENRALRRIFGPEPKRAEVGGGGKDYITRSFIMCMFHAILLG
jgi:hypothetical protein